MKAKRLSLSWELHELEFAVGAALMLCRATSEGQHVTEADAAQAPRGAPHDVEALEAFEAFECFELR